MPFSHYFFSCEYGRNNNDLYLVGDFNIDALDHENNVKVKML